MSTTSSTAVDQRRPSDVTLAQRQRIIAAGYPWSARGPRARSRWTSVLRGTGTEHDGYGVGGSGGDGGSKAYRTAAQPRHLPALHPAVPHQGGDPAQRRGLQRGPGGVRARVRAGQGRAPRARHPARDRQQRPVVRRRGRAIASGATRTSCRRSRSRPTRWQSSVWPRGSGSRRASPRRRAGRCSSSRRSTRPTPWPRTCSASSRGWSATSRASRGSGRRCRSGRAVEFDYRTRDGRQSRRHLEPWGLVAWHGRWYAVGHDRDRDDVRVFRVGRITSDVDADRTARAGSRCHRTSTCARSSTRSRTQRRRAPPRSGSPRARAVGCGGRRSASRCPIPTTTAGWCSTCRTATSSALVDDVVGYGPNAVVVGPPEAREAARDRLLGALDAGGWTA